MEKKLFLSGSLEPNPTFYVAAFWNEFVNEGFKFGAKFKIFEKKMSIQSSEEGF